MTRRLPCSIAALAALLTLAACGGDDSGSDTTVAAATTAAPATTAAAATTAAEATTTAAPATTAATPTTAAAATSAPATAAPTTTEPESALLRVLVTNDDGVAAPGLDALVQALQSLEVDVTVVAPAEQQSGQGGNVTDGPLTVTDATTASGFPAKAVAGFPADTVIWAIDQHGIDFVPDLVIAGANEGQNLGPVVDFSGTVGAARAAATRNIPAIAVSAGFGEPVDYQAATDAVVAYLTEHIGEIAGHPEGAPVDEVISINTPTCAMGTDIRGTVEVPLATDLQGFDYGAPVDCTGTTDAPADDVQAFFNGFVAISPTPVQPATG
jgi:5'-nucleotidase